MTSKPTFLWASATDVGLVRSVNQDSLFVAEGLFVVADGMGGHQGGEVASQVATQTLGGTIEGDEGELTSGRELIERIQNANEAILAQGSADSSLRGMGTTVSAIAVLDGFHGAILGVANVGDSRVYRLRDGSLEQITEDHSLVAELVRDGRLSEEEAEHHPRKNVLTRALGITSPVEVDLFEHEVVAGDRFLICSDGLTNEVAHDDIAATLGSDDSLDDLAQRLVEMANDGGGRDNTTVVLVDVVSVGDGPEPIISDDLTEDLHEGPDNPDADPAEPSGESTETEAESPPNPEDDPTTDTTPAVDAEIPAGEIDATPGDNTTVFAAPNGTPAAPTASAAAPVSDAPVSDAPVSTAPVSTAPVGAVTTSATAGPPASGSRWPRLGILGLAVALVVIVVTVIVLLAR